jgi:hypothetical protein
MIRTANHAKNFQKTQKIIESNGNKMCDWEKIKKEMSERKTKN